MLTKEALDRVFAHTNEKCEKTTTLWVEVRSITCNKCVRTHWVADSCVNAKRRLPCWRKCATEAMKRRGD